MRSINYGEYRMRVLNLLKVRVTRAQGWTRPDETKTAAVVVGGEDLFDSLEQAVARLKLRGWTVVDVAAFKIGISLGDCSSDGVLRDLYYIAKASGFAYRIEKYEKEEMVEEQPSSPSTETSLAAL
jgi:thiamine monophosphate kinase